jgi:hypothetical protein
VRQTSALMWTLFLCLSAFLIDARAGEQLYDDTHCFAGTSAMVFRSKELTVLSYELRGWTPILLNAAMRLRRQVTETVPSRSSGRSVSQAGPGWSGQPSASLPG